MNPYTSEELDIIDIVERGMQGGGLTDEEMLALYSVDPKSRVASYIRWGGGTFQRELCDNKAQIHGQIGLNATPCPKNCKFCSFAICNDLRHGRVELPVEEVVECAKLYQEEGVNVILLLATASYKFDKVLEMARAVREVIDPAMPLLTNTDDMSLEQARALKAAGVNGAYHAVRMREGLDTGIPAEKRMESFEHLRQAGLSISTCVEPVGPEHTPEELTRASRICMDSGANSAGVGRRISVPGTEIYERGMIDDVTSSMYVAIYRLVAGQKQMLNCAMVTSLTAASGANLAWAEVGTNPRDTKERTQDGGRGTNVEFNRRMFKAAGYDIFQGPSQGWML